MAIIIPGQPEKILLYYEVIKFFNRRKSRLSSEKNRLLNASENAFTTAPKAVGFG